MNRYRLVQLDSIDQLRAAAPVWDDLWWRSDVAFPTYRAELVAQWVEQFAPGEEFRALVVADQRQWVAALPLVSRKLCKVIRACELPLNEWISRGEVLWDAAADADAVMDLLAQATADLPRQLLWFDEVPLDAPRWQALVRALARAGMTVEIRPRYCVGRMTIDHDWQAYRRHWSRKHRQAMSRLARRLSDRGEVQLTTLGQLAPDQVEEWMRQAFEVEDRSWKGGAGSSVLRWPGMFAFFNRQAEQLAEWGQLALHFLEAQGHPIAFAYGMQAKGVYHSCKIGYDAEYAAYAPGQLLRCRMLEAFHDDPQCRAVDFIGPMTEAHRQWRPDTYRLGRVLVAPRRGLGRTFLRGYQRFGPLLRRLRGKTDPDHSATESMPTVPDRDSVVQPR
ncbi:MAG: GNAT family N-acetyltransferase [Pirellulales bacterium]|nr:GNAT family N-acetyltransferase [Pirellulales bacterium]